MSILPSHRNFINRRNDPNDEKRVIYDCQDEISVLLLGSTGNGKSTTANWLLQVQGVFKESDEIDPCTKDPQNDFREIKFEYGTTERENIQVNCKVRVFDTPGLNEPDELEELANSKRIIELLSKLNQLTMVFFCVKYDQKNDNQFRPTFEYYRKLLPQIFETDNWGIIVTKIVPKILDKFPNPMDYEEDKKKQLVKALNLSKPHIPHLFYYNPYEEKMHRHNLKAHTMLMRCLVVSNNKPLDDLCFPLPPQYESIRKQMVETSNSCSDTLSQAFQNKEEKRSKLAKRLQRYFNEISKLSQEIGDLQQQIDLASRPIYRQIPAEWGGDVFSFSQKSKSVTIPLENLKYLRNTKKWNCKETEVLQKEEKQLIITLHVDRLNLKSFEGKKWFWETTMIYDGKNQNQENIERWTGEIEKKEDMLDEKKRSLQKKSELSEKELQESQNIIRQYNELFYIVQKMSKDTFPKESIYSVFDLLIAFQKAERNLNSMNFDKFEDFHEMIRICPKLPPESVNTPSTKRISKREKKVSKDKKKS